MLKKFKDLPMLKKTIIILALIVAFFVFAPLTVKYVSAGEIDLFAMLQDLIFRVDQQEARSDEQETRIGELETRLAEYEISEEPEDPAAPEEPGGDPGGSGDGSIPPDNGDPPTPPPDGNDPEPDEEPTPEEPEEPEPLLPLAKVDYKLTPQRSNSGRMVYRFEGTKLYCDFYRPVPEKMKYDYLIWERREEETEYAFTEVIDLVGAWEKWHNEGVKPVLKGQLPVNIIIDPKRIGDTIEFDLLNWFGSNAPYEVRFPARQVYTLP